MDAGGPIMTTTRTMARYPDFFIVGAPKSGTTALQSYLAQHPSVLMPQRVEPGFFAPDLFAPGEHPMCETDYAALFRQASPAHLVGERSTCYLLSTESASNIKTWVPQARIIAMLRNPTSQIPSLHAHMSYREGETLTLADALAAEDDRARLLSAGVPMRWAMLYKRIARYTAQVARYFEAFGQENVLVLLYDDFARDTPGSWQAIARFLDIDPSFRPSFGVVNAAKGLRSQRMMDRIDDQFGVLHRVARSVVPERYRDSVYQAAVRLNTRRRLVPLPEEPLLASIREEFRDEVGTLGQLIGRDLSDWLSPTASAAAGR
jgi:hypothetical protein